MKKRKKVLLMIAVCVLVVGVGFGLSYFLRYRQYEQAIQKITIPSIALSEKADGFYIGECDVDFIAAKVKVEMKGGNIVDIQFIEYHHDRGEAAKVIPKKIVEKQRIDVDTISGATNASKVIQKAVANALE